MFENEISGNVPHAFVEYLGEAKKWWVLGDSRTVYNIGLTCTAKDSYGRDIVQEKRNT